MDRPVMPRQRPWGAFRSRNSFRSQGANNCRVATQIHTMIRFNMGLRLLRLFLGFAAFAWGISVVGVFLSWSAAVDALRGLGAEPIAYDRMQGYSRYAKSGHAKPAA